MPSPWAKWLRPPAPTNMRYSPACAGCRRPIDEYFREHRPRHSYRAGPYRAAGAVHRARAGLAGVAAHLYPPDPQPDHAHRLLFPAGGGADGLLHRRRAGAADISGRQPLRRRGHRAPGYGSGRHPRTAPAIAGLMIAGRVGAAIAAEIGTMKVTEQI